MYGAREAAYRAHSTFRPVFPDQGLNNTTYLFFQKSRVHQQGGLGKLFFLAWLLCWVDGGDTTKPVAVAA